MLPHLYNIGFMILISGIVAVGEDKGSMPSTTPSLFGVGYAMARNPDSDARI